MRSCTIPPVLGAALSSPPTHSLPPFSPPPLRSFSSLFFSAWRRLIRSPIATNSRDGRRKGRVVFSMFLFAFSHEAGRGWHVHILQCGLCSSSSSRLVYTVQQDINKSPFNPQSLSFRPWLCARQSALGSNPTRSSPFTRH